MADRRFDWPGLMRLGVGRLGLAPETFWNLTPAELLAVAGLEAPGGAAMGRAAFEALAARFPDTPAPGRDCKQEMTDGRPD